MKFRFLQYLFCGVWMEFVRVMFFLDFRIFFRNQYLCILYLLDINYLINIRFLGGKEFRCYLIVRFFQVKRRCLFLFYSLIYLKSIWKLSRWVICEFFLRWNFLFLLVKIVNSIFVINLILDGYDEIYFLFLQGIL